jgi:hypothetical protein
LARLLAPPLGPDELGRLGDYRVLDLLGRGGMGVVLAAEDPQLRRRVALKVIQPEATTNPRARARFLREARAAAKLQQHDHIVPIYHVGEQNGVAFMVMPLLAGESLEDHLERESRLPPAEVLRIGREATEGLVAAHAAGLVHRDIKPGNLWLEAPTGRVRILDFGLAREVAADGDGAPTRAGAGLGTPAYMSPEQAAGRPVDGRSDLFSLGCVLYHMATGEPPFPGKTLTAVLRAVAEHHPPPPREVRPGLPAALSDLILRLLAKDPDQRPASARAVADALAAIRPRRTWLTAAGVGAVLLAVGAAVLYASRNDSRPDAHPSVSAVAVAPTQAVVDIRVWRTGPNGAAARLRLTDLGALPLKPGDQFRIEATADRPAYLYLFWIDTEGKALPVYPWQPGEWDSRPAEERPVAALELPQAATKGYKISGDQPGMETLILVARTERLGLTDEQIRLWFAGLPAQRPFQNPESAVWFENGRIVTDDGDRQKRGFDETAIADPVLRIQGLLKERIGPHAAATAAVSFARLGQGGVP